MNLKPLLIVPPIVLGVVGFMWMTASQERVVEPTAEARLAVRVVPIEPLPVSVVATGYGRVEAVRNWSAVSQVDGRITALFDDLAEGTLVGNDAVLVQIDPTDYELAVRKSQANIAAAEASLLELSEQEANAERLIEIEQRVLDVARSENERVIGLAARGTSTQSALDTAQKNLLVQETSMVSLQNNLALFPAQRASMEATLAVRRAELAEAERELANTTVRAPFAGRASEVLVETGQFIRTGEELLTVSNTDSVEIKALMQPRVLSPVLRFSIGRNIAETTELDAAKVVQYLNEAGVAASVRLNFPGGEMIYPAEIARFTGTIDTETGALGVVIRVDLNAGGRPLRPPLTVGSFVSVDLTTRPMDGVFTVPRSAVHYDDDGAPFVYTANSEDRLALTPVTLGVVVGDSYVVDAGLAAGDRLILSAPRPPIEGLLLTPVSANGSE